MRNQVLLGDSVEVLRGFPDAFFDACVTDPPYGLGSKEPGGPEIEAYLAGEARLDTGGDFMGKEWDIPSVALWREVYRTLRPGAVLMAFAGTRTLDLMAAGIGAAGFKYVGICGWLHGQGFPKSLSVDKAIDKVNGESGRLHKFTEWMRTTGLTIKEINEATGTFMGSHYLTAKSQPSIPTPEIWAKLRPLCGVVPEWVDELVDRIQAKREVVGSSKKPDFRYVGPGPVSAQGLETSPTRMVDITVPSTEAAKEWDGWGTALKPAWEPVLMFTKGESDWQMPVVPFYYCPKPAKAEKNADGEVRNDHVTVKPLRLMQWLVGLACPKGGLVLEPFLGSGTTAAACAEEGRDFVGIERDPHYFGLASKRVGVVKGRAEETQRQRDAFDFMAELPEE